MTPAGWIVAPEPGPVAGRLVLDAVRAVLAERPRCLLAVPGGTTPAPVFRWLAAHVPADVAARLTVVPVDERHVPGPAQVDAASWPSLHPDANLRLVWEHWVSQTAHPPAALPLDAPGPLDRALAVVERTLPGDPDVALLGLGPDGHVASLFPGHAGLAGTARLLALSDSPKPPPERLSFSLASLSRARAVVVLATGAGKAAAVARMAARDPALPLTALRGPVLHVVLDPAAAAHLQESA